MMKDHQAEYKELLEELRHRYRQKYNAVLDDEILYLVIRVNELQVDLKKEIREIQKVTFKKGIDYFWYGVGKTVGFLILGVGLIIMAFFLFNFIQSKKTVLVVDNQMLKAQVQKGTKGDTTINKKAGKNKK